MSSNYLRHLFPEEEVYHFRSSVLIIINKPWSSIGEREQQLLEKILLAVRVSIAQVHILHLSNVTAQNLVNYNPDRVIVFGADTEELPLYQSIKKDSFSIVKADALEELDDARKKSLWVALKALFGIA